MNNVLIVGLSGVTNGGKTVLSKNLLKVLPSWTKLLKQDDYFLPEDSPRHVPCSKDIKHHNWDIISSIDMDKLIEDVKTIVQGNEDTLFKSESVSSLCTICDEDYTSKSINIDSIHKLVPMLQNCNNHRKILLIDGFTLYDDQLLSEMCELKFFLTLPKEECFARRQRRLYDPPDPPGYFDVCVWPMYEAHLNRVKQFKDVQFFDGQSEMDDIFCAVLKKILSASIL